MLSQHLINWNIKMIYRSFQMFLTFVSFFDKFFEIFHILLNGSLDNKMNDINGLSFWMSSKSDSRWNLIFLDRSVSRVQNGGSFLLLFVRKMCMKFFRVLKLTGERKNFPWKRWKIPKKILSHIFHQKENTEKMMKLIST